MPQVIIYETENGNVAVCYPTGELPIETVLTKDCPEGAMIVDSSILPNADNDFFDAWILNGSNVTVDISKAVSVQQNNLNILARTEANHRMMNNGAGIANKLSDSDWLSLLSTARSTISTCTTTQQLRDALKPVIDSIDANA